MTRDDRLKTPLPDTLANLRPSWPVTLQRRLPENSPRAFGSHLLPRPQPHREGVWIRPWQPGDPTRMIDWKAYARADQLLVRQDRPESSVLVTVVLDISSTMRWPDDSVPVVARQSCPRKIELAGRVAFHLAHLFLSAGDRVRLYLLEDGQTLPARVIETRDAIALERLFEDWEQSGFDLRALLDLSFAERLETSRASLAFWISDFLGAGASGELAKYAKRVSWIQTLSTLERNIGWVEPHVCCYDQPPHTQEYRGRMLRENRRYATSLENWLRDVASRAAQKSIPWFLVDEATAISSFHDFLDGVPFPERASEEGSP